MKKVLILMLMFGGLIFAGSEGIAQAADNYPSRSIEFFCPWPAGSGLFMSQRVLAQAASEQLGRPVIVVGKPGAGGTVAAEYVLSSKPDGYKLFLFNSGTNGITVAVRDVRFTNSDFDIICGSYIQNLILMVPTNSPFKSVDDLVAYAKKNPGKLKYATTGVGTSSQGLIDAGKLRMLAVANAKRASNLPKVPTFAENGYPQMVFNVWYGIAGPKGLPENVSKKLQEAFGKASQDKTVAKMLHKLGYTEHYMPKMEFEKFVAKEVAKFKKIVKEANIQIK